MTALASDYDVGAAVRQHPAPWPHLSERCDMTKPTCSIEGCTNPHYGRSYCAFHYQRVRRHGDPRRGRAVVVRFCDVEDCGRRAKAKGLCGLHYRRVAQHGKPGPAGPTRAARSEPRQWLSSQVATASRIPCWDWPFALNPSGYGQVNIGGRPVGAHRLAREMDGRPIPEGLVARHTCDNRRCCNPDHIIEGTKADNNRDAAERQRMARGSRNGQARLTEGQVQHIRRLLASGQSRRSIGQQFGVTDKSIKKIATGETWGWLS